MKFASTSQLRRAGCRIVSRHFSSLFRSGKMEEIEPVLQITAANATVALANDLADSSRGHHEQQDGQHHRHGQTIVIHQAGRMMIDPGHPPRLPVASVVIRLWRPCDERLAPSTAK